MAFQRRILHHGADPDGMPQLLSLVAVKNCWFELHRQGGCGSGQLVLSESFEQRDLIQVGDWISCEGAPGDRWYLGRVEERQAAVPAGLKLRLEGMSIELNQYFPGGFGSDADGARPHIYAATDLFQQDPDGEIETFDALSSVEELVGLLMTQSVPTTSHIQYVAERVETPELPAPVTSLKVRGEESVRSILKDLSLRAQSASWGVDEQGEFFFLRPRTDVLATFQDQRDLTSLTESRDLEYVFNRILMTGDYVYDQVISSDDVARRAYRWRSSFLEPISRAQFGDRRIRVWLPWIRTQSDALAFSRQFFRTYSQPQSRYLVETTAGETLPRPWLGQIQVNAATGEPLISARVETLRVKFDHVPLFRMELGPADPRQLWPEPPQDERWELPNHVQSNGGEVSLPPPLPPGPGGGGGGGGGGPPHDSSGGFAVGSSSIGSDGSSVSDESSDGSSDDSLESSGGSESFHSHFSSEWPSFPSVSGSADSQGSQSDSSASDSGSSDDSESEASSSAGSDESSGDSSHWSSIASSDSWPHSSSVDLSGLSSGSQGSSEDDDSSDDGSSDSNMSSFHSSDTGEVSSSRHLPSSEIGTYTFFG